MDKPKEITRNQRELGKAETGAAPQTDVFLAHLNEGFLRLERSQEAGTRPQRPPESSGLVKPETVPMAALDPFGSLGSSGSIRKTFFNT